MLRGQVAIAPILAEQAVETASPVENREIGESRFSVRFVCILGIADSSATWTEPPADAVRREIVIIPFQNSLFWRTAEADQLAVDVTDYATESATVRTDSAVVRTDPA